MESLVLQSIAMLAVTYGVFAGLGWLLAGKKKRVRAVAPAVDWEVETPVVELKTPEKPQPVSYLDAAAEHFTQGLTVPSNLPPAMVAAVERAPTLIVKDALPQHRVSSLASMTPDSVEAAVQQAGAGLEPVRLSAPQGPVDDLTIISCIDRHSQEDLNALGIYHYWQIAGWAPEHVAWVSNRIRLSKRIARENWMSQAARLARLG